MKDAVCYSGALTERHELGSPHYSYRFAQEKFLFCFSKMGIEPHFLAMPEYFGSPRALAQLPRYNGQLVHFIFRSTEQVRILKGAYNVICFAWEFPHLKDTNGNDEHPFSNQKRMLSLCDEIWVPCAFTKEVLARHGLAKVHRIPAPVEALPFETPARPEALRRIGHIDCKALDINFLGHYGRNGDDYTPLFQMLNRKESTSRRQIYLSIFNPEDFRKNFDAMVRGFDAFQQRNPDAFLIIKALTSNERFSLDRVVHDVMAAKLTSGSSFFNSNIIIFNRFLDDEEMAALYGLADFYLCTSIAEGQNLPLLEAMGRGLVPITTCNTAMQDYIRRNNAIVIETKKLANENPHLAGNIAGKPYDVELCSARHVRAALEASQRLEDADYAQMSRAAVATVESGFSANALRPHIAERLQSGAASGSKIAGQEARRDDVKAARFSGKVSALLPKPAVRHIADRG